jgi:ankyrin repeat protein
MELNMMRITTLLLAVLTSLLQSAYCTSIHDAVATGDIKTVTELIKANPDLIRAKDVEDWTPLHFAVIADKNRYELVKFLLKNGADVNAKTKYLDTALSLAAQRHEIEIAKLLLGNKAEVDAQADDGWTPLHKAVSNCDQQMVDLLLANGANPEVNSKSVGPPLHLAALDCKKEMVERLLASHADVNARNSSGLTALDVAMNRIYFSPNDQDAKDVIAVLKNHGAK